jgi:hypothetical protein
MVMITVGSYGSRKAEESRGELHVGRILYN